MSDLEIDEYEGDNALSVSYDFENLSLDELLDLREQLELEISNRGYKVYYDLTRGDKGEEVAKLQERLKELGYYAGAISGKYDTETQKAMKQFEKTNGLTNDGDASREDQIILFSDNAAVKEIPVNESKSKSTPTPTLDPILQDYGPFDYEDCSRYPENHVGEKVVLKGKVIQVMGDRKKGFTIRLATSGSSNVVYVTTKHDPGFNILDNDRLTVYATMNGTKTYTSVLSSSITIPYAIADIIELRK